jgi:type II secretory pathway component PulJ
MVPYFIAAVLLAIVLAATIASLMVLLRTKRRLSQADELSGARKSRARINTQIGATINDLSAIIKRACETR